MIVIAAQSGFVLLKYWPPDGSDKGGVDRWPIIGWVITDDEVLPITTAGKQDEGAVLHPDGQIYDGCCLIATEKEWLASEIEMFQRRAVRLDK